MGAMMMAEADAAVLASLVGLFAGWLLLTYGVLLWGLGDSILGLQATSRVSVAYPFAFVTSGIGILLIANGAVVASAGRVALLEIIGYILIVALGTAIFLLRVIYLHYDVRVPIPTETNGNGNGDGVNGAK